MKKYRMILLLFVMLFMTSCSMKDKNTASDISEPSQKISSETKTDASSESVSPESETDASSESVSPESETDASSESVSPESETDTSSEPVSSEVSATDSENKNKEIIENGHSIENGKYIYFSNALSEIDKTSYAYTYKINNDSDISDIKRLNNWFSIFGFDEDTLFDAKTAYFGDYYLHISIHEINNSGEDTGKILFCGDVLLNDETLYPEKLIPDEEAPYEEMLSSVKLPSDEEKLLKDYRNYPNYKRMLGYGIYSKGKAYVVASNSGSGAGHTFYNCFRTADGGDTWQRINYRFQLSNVLYRYSFFCIENGDILIFYHPYEYYYYSDHVESIGFDKDLCDVKEIPKGGWFSIFGFDKDTVFFAYPEYKGDFSLHMKITEKIKGTSYEDGKNARVLFEGTVILDPDTLYPKEIIKD